MSLSHPLEPTPMLNIGEIKERSDPFPMTRESISFTSLLNFSIPFKVFIQLSAILLSMDPSFSALTLFGKAKMRRWFKFAAHRMIYQSKYLSPHNHQILLLILF